MTQQSHEPKIQLRQPKPQIKKPERSGSGMLIAGAFVMGFMILVSLVRGGESNKRSEVKLTPSQGADAADQVDRLTQELMEKAKQGKPSNLLKMAGDDTSHQSLNGVQFKLNVPSEWKTSSRGTTLVVRKEKDPRICQLTAVAQYDTLGLIAEVKGKEVEFEADYIKQGIAQGAPGAQVATSGKLLTSSYDKTRLHYAVRTRIRMTVGGRSIEQSGVNAVYAVGSRMVRLQCMNMSGASDEDDAMGTMGRTLLIPST